MSIAFRCQGRFGCPLVSSLIPGASFFTAPWYHISSCIKASMPNCRGPIHFFAPPSDFGAPVPFAIDKSETYHFSNPLRPISPKLITFRSIAVDRSETYHFPTPLRSISPKLITFPLRSIGPKLITFQPFAIDKSESYQLPFRSRWVRNLSSVSFPVRS